MLESELALVMSLEQIAEIFQFAALVATILIVPYSTLGLIWQEWHPNVRYVRNNPSAYYRPSLDYLTWLNSAFLFAIVLIVGTYALRFYLHIENGRDSIAEQPPWSYALSMFVTTFLLCVFVLPSTFLLNLKRHIVSEEPRDVGTALARDTNKRVKEIQARGLAEQPDEQADRAEGREHRHPDCRDSDDVSR